jgi:3'-5' exoribonuclease
MQIGIVMKQYVKDLKQGERVESLFAIKFKKPPKRYAHGHMFELRISDKSDEITAKYWGDDDIDSIQTLYDSFSKGDVVRLTGMVNEYRGALEIAISKGDGDTLDKRGKGEYEIGDFVAKTPRDIGEMVGKLKEVIESVSDPNLKSLLDSFFKDEAFLKDFSFTPASMHYHQNYFGGLLEHTLNVVELCETTSRLFPKLNRDLVITGALLHDIGKMREFEVSTSIDVTEDGMLRGHLIIGEGMVKEKTESIPDFPDVLKFKMLHIMLSHHGKKDYGSPKEPQFPEALAVYYADETDAKIDLLVRMKEEARTEDPWTWTKRTGHIYLK